MNIESRWQKVQWKMLKNRHNIECRLKRLIGRKKKPQTRCGKRKRKIPTIPPLLFVCPFRLNSVNILVPSFQHPQQASRYHTERSLSDLSHLSPLQAPTPLRNPLHSLSSTLRACSQSTSTATHHNRLYAGHDRNRTASHPSAVFRWPPSCLACCFPAKVAFPLGCEVKWKR